MARKPFLIDLLPPLLNNIERGVANPKPASIKAIRRALENEGIEFLEENGVRERGEKFEFRTIEGQEILRKYYLALPFRVLRNLSRRLRNN